MNTINISPIKSTLPVPDKQLDKELFRARDFINAKNKTSNIITKANGDCSIKSMIETVERVAYALKARGVEMAYVGRFKTIYTVMLEQKLNPMGIEMKYFTLDGGLE